MSCCKVTDKEFKDTVDNKRGGNIIAMVIVFGILLVLFPILYLYIIFMVCKQVVTGKGNSVGNIVNDLKKTFTLLYFNKDDEEINDYMDFDEDDLVLEDLIDEEYKN